MGAIPRRVRWARRGRRTARRAAFFLLFAEEPRGAVTVRSSVSAVVFSTVMVFGMAAATPAGRRSGGGGAGPGGGAGGRGAGQTSAVYAALDAMRPPVAATASEMPLCRVWMF